MRQRKYQLLVIGLLGAGVALAQAAPACDRDCLKGFTTQYLNAMVAHKPSDVPTASNFKFTEDGKVLSLGEGIWKSDLRLTPYRFDILDLRQGVAGSHSVVDVNGSPALFALRLKFWTGKSPKPKPSLCTTRPRG